MKGKDRRAWMFVVDTDAYAGNFEREMGAYLTGKVGKYFPGISKVLSKLYREETGDTYATLFVSVLGKHERDPEHGSTYVGTWDTPGWFNNGVGGHFRDGQEAEALEHHRKYYLKEAKNVSHLHPNDQERTMKERLKCAEEPLFKWPAGMSVAIAFTERPSVEQLSILEKRAKGFPEAVKKAMKEAETLPWHVKSERNIYFTGPIPRITGTRLLRRDGDRDIEQSSST